MVQPASLMMRGCYKPHQGNFGLELLRVLLRCISSDSVSRQAFPRKIGQNMRGVSETHEWGYDNITYNSAMPHTHSDSHAALRISHIWTFCFTTNCFTVRQHGCLTCEYFELNGRPYQQIVSSGKLATLLHVLFMSMLIIINKEMNAIFIYCIVDGFLMTKTVRN